MNDKTVIENLELFIWVCISKILHTCRSFQFKAIKYIKPIKHYLACRITYHDIWKQFIATILLAQRVNFSMEILCMVCVIILENTLFIENL